MARTEAFRTIERAARPFSRRRFLQGAGAAAAALALPRCARERDVRVVVVGAGLAGLSCAYRLAAQGVRPVVLEAAARVGGRTMTVRDALGTPHKVELGGEFVDSGHTAIRGLVDELGLHLVDLHEAAPPADIYFIGGRTLTVDELVDAFEPVAELIARDLDTLDGDGDVTYRDPNGGSVLDRMSITDWMDARGVSGDIRTAIEVAYTCEYGRDADSQSCLNMLYLIGEAGSFDVYGDSDERFNVREGSDAIATRLAADLTVETGSRLDAVSQRGDGTYVLSVREGSSSRDVLADRVVLAIPFTVLRQVDIRVDLPAVKRRAIDELGYGSNAILAAGFSTAPWRPGNGSSFTDLAYQSSTEGSLGQPGEGAIMTNFTGGSHGASMDRGTPEDLARTFVSELDRVFPGSAAAANGQAIRYHWTSDPLALGSYSCYLPGQYSTIAGAERERVGGLHFAGEHTEYEFQGYMEGAVRSGERAARQILREV